MPTLTLTQSQYLQLTTTGVANYLRRVKVPAAHYFEDITPMGQTYFRTADGLLNIIYPHHAIGASVLARERGNKKKSPLVLAVCIGITTDVMYICTTVSNRYTCFFIFASRHELEFSFGFLGLIRVPSPCRHSFFEKNEGLKKILLKTLDKCFNPTYLCPINHTKK